MSESVFALLIGPSASSISPKKDICCSQILSWSAFGYILRGSASKLFSFSAAFGVALSTAFFWLTRISDTEAGRSDLLSAMEY